MYTSLFHRFQPKTFIVLRNGYSFQYFFKDLFSGVTVGIVALPLAMAFGIASGVAPENGLFTAIVAGFVISLFGGSRYQIGGPTGAFVVIIYNTVAKHGFDGLVIATIMAGIILIILGATGLGRLIKYIPDPVITGFTTGIGLIIFSSQIKDFFGLSMTEVPPDFIHKIEEYAVYMDSASLQATALSISAIAAIILVRKFVPRIPAHVVGVVVATAAVQIFGLGVETIGSKFGSIPTMLPSPSLPEVTFAKIQEVMPISFTIAFLAGIESLLSAVVADGMTGDRHNSNVELIAQGAANIVSVLFGGISATGAIARTATNIKAGAYSPVSGVIHSIVLLLFIFFLAPLAEMIPLAALAAVLIVVAWDMSDLHRFKMIFRTPKSDVTVMLISFFLTVLVDLTVAVEVGFLMAAVLFMKRMADVSEMRQAHLFDEDEYGSGQDSDATDKKIVPKGVEIYEINGPFFFGIVDVLKDITKFIEKKPKIFILRMRHVPAIDASGINSLVEFYEKCRKDGIILILSGVAGQPGKALKKFGFDKLIGEHNITNHIDKALTRANHLLSAKVH